MWNLKETRLFNIKTRSELELLASILNTKYDYCGPIDLANQLGYKVCTTNFNDDETIVYIPHNEKTIYIKEDKNKDTMSYYLFIAIAMIDLTPDNSGNIKESLNIKNQDFYNSIIMDYATMIMLPKNFIKTLSAKYPDKAYLAKNLDVNYGALVRRLATLEYF